MQTVSDINKILTSKIEEMKQTDSQAASQILYNMFGIRFPMSDGSSMMLNPYMKSQHEFIRTSIKQENGFDIRSASISWFHPHVIKKYFGDFVLHKDSGYTYNDFFDLVYPNRIKSIKMRMMLSTSIFYMRCALGEDVIKLNDYIYQEMKNLVNLVESTKSVIVVMDVDRIVYISRKGEYSSFEWDIPIHFDKHKNIYVVDKNGSFIMDYDNSSYIRSALKSNRLLTKIIKGIKFDF